MFETLKKNFLLLVENVFLFLRIKSLSSNLLLLLLFFFYGLFFIVELHPYLPQPELLQFSTNKGGLDKNKS